MAINFVPVGTYNTPTGPIIQSAQDEVIALINAALALLPNPDASPPTAGATPRP